jgi:hypothetical protein
VLLATLLCRKDECSAGMLEMEGWLASFLGLAGGATGESRIPTMLDASTATPTASCPCWRNKWSSTYLPPRHFPGETLNLVFQIGDGGVVVSCFLMRTSLLEVELVRGMVVHGGGRQCWDLWLAGDGMTTCPANGDVAAR